MKLVGIALAVVVALVVGSYVAQTLASAAQELTP